MTTAINSQITVLYEHCTSLRRIFIAIERQVEVVQEISLNASVSAGQLGSHATACAEIAQQVNGTARRMRGYIDSMRREVNEITGQVLTMLIQTGRLEKYEAARVSVVGAGNQQAVAAVVDQITMLVVDMAASLQQNVHQASAMLRLLARCHQRLFIALSALEIEAVNLSPAHSQVIMALVDRLGKVADDGAEQVEDATKVLGRIRKLALFVQETTYKETVRAKIRAA